MLWVGLLSACGPTTTTPGESCGGNAVYDCASVCVSTVYLGDGTCHDGSFVADFSCEALAFDEGDCGACGDGVRNQGEECDDGNDRTGDGCRPDCTEEPLPDTAVGLDTGPSVCGDGERTGAETCDDGNRVNGDGCTKVCTIERLEADFLILEVASGIDRAQKAVPVTVQNVAQPIRFTISAIRLTGGGNQEGCGLDFRPRATDFASVPPEGLGDNPSELQLWLKAHGAVWGFQVVPGEDTYDSRVDGDCYLELDDYAGDPHASFLGTSPVYVGLTAVPTEAASAGFELVFPDSSAIITADRRLGAVFELPDTIAPKANRFEPDGVAFARQVADDGSVVVAGNQFVYLAAAGVIQMGLPVQAWYGMLTGNVYETAQ